MGWEICIDCGKTLTLVPSVGKKEVFWVLCAECFARRKEQNKEKLRRIFNAETEEIRDTIVPTGKDNLSGKRS